MNVVPAHGPRPLTVVEVTVADGYADAVVEVRPDAVRTSGLPGFAGMLLGALPGLVSHECTNGAGRPFAEELRDTEIAHAFEHVALQIMRMAGTRASGETEWDFARDGRGRYRVRLGFDDDLVCLGALRLAEEVVAAAAGEAEMHPIAEGIARLRGLAGRG